MINIFSNPVNPETHKTNDAVFDCQKHMYPPSIDQHTQNYTNHTLFQTPHGTPDGTTKAPAGPVTRTPATNQPHTIYRKLANVISGLPEGITKTALFRSFVTKDAAKRGIKQLETLLSFLPASTQHLSLHGNRFNDQTLENVNTLLQTSPIETCTALDLSGNSIGHKTDLLKTVLQTLATHAQQLEKLDLSQNSLHAHSKEQLQAAFSEMPPTLHTLCLRQNITALTTTPAWLRTLLSAASSKSVETLDLSENKLGQLQGEEAELKNVFGALLPTVTVLDLSDNELWTPNGIALLRGIPSTVTQLILTGNQFDQHQISHQDIVDALPKTITQLIVTDNDPLSKCFIDTRIASSDPKEDAASHAP